MRILKLTILGLAIYGGVTLARRVRAAWLAREEEEDAITDADLVVVAVESGIAEVDPEALAQMGEGIDLDANSAAHEELASQRERMPGR